MKRSFTIILVVMLIVTACGGAVTEPENSTEGTTEEVTEEITEETTAAEREEVSEEAIEPDTEENNQDNDNAGAIPDQDFNDMTYVMDGCDFRRSKWGASIDEVSKDEPVWEDFSEDPTQEQFDGEKVFVRTFVNDIGTYGRTVTYYHFDNDRLYKGLFVTAFEGVTGIDTAFDNIYDQIKERLGSDAIDNKYVNCVPDNFMEKLSEGDAMKLSGWELEDGTMVIECIMPLGEGINILTVGYFDPNTDKPSVMGGYDMWLQLSTESAVQTGTYSEKETDKSSNDEKVKYKPEKKQKSDSITINTNNLKEGVNKDGNSFIIVSKRDGDMIPVGEGIPAGKYEMEYVSGNGSFAYYMSDNDRFNYYMGENYKDSNQYFSADESLSMELKDGGMLLPSPKDVDAGDVIVVKLTAK